MTIDTIYRNRQFTCDGENASVAFPIAAPLVFVMHLVQKFLFGNTSAHPAIQNLLVSSKHGLNSNNEVAFLLSQPADKLGGICLTLWQRMVVPDPNQFRQPGLVEDVLRVTDVLESLELTVKFLDIFASW